MYMRRRVPSPGMLARKPIRLSLPAVSQTFTVAQARAFCLRAAVSAPAEPAGSTATAAVRRASETRRTGRIVETAAESGDTSHVMDPPPARSTGVNEAIAEPAPALAATTEAESFEALYRRTFPRVYAYVASLLRDRAAAEDATALAFERAYRKRRGYRPGRGTREAWLFGIARNAALDELRGRKRRATLEADPEDVDVPAPDDQADLALTRETVRAALAKLAPRERELVALKFMAGLSNAEIAAVLGVSESNVGTRLHRTVNKLREACDGRA